MDHPWQGIDVFGNAIESSPGANLKVGALTDAGRRHSKPLARPQCIAAGRSVAGVRWDTR